MPGQKEKLQFVIKGKKMAYEGYPEHRERDLFDLIVKSKLSPEEACDVYRKNMPDSALVDADILSRLEAAKEAKAAKKRAKEEAARAAAAAEASAAGAPAKTPAPVPEAQLQQQQQVEAVDPSQQGYYDANGQWVYTDPATQAYYQQQQQQEAQGHPQDNLAEEQSDGFSETYRNEVTNFISQVVNAPRDELRTQVRGSISAGAPSGSYDSAPAHARRESNVAEEDAAMAAAAPAGSKQMVYLHLDGSESTKVVSVLQNVSYDDFHAVVEKKFGFPVALHFDDDEDKIDLDDDDTLEMFFAVCGRDKKKLKVQCRQLKPVKEDNLTTKADTRAGSEGRAGAAASDAPSKADVSSTATSTFTGHGGAIYCCAFAPTSDRFISASRDKTVRLWNTTDGSNQAMKGGHPEMVLSTDFSPDAEHIVSSSVDPVIKMWKASTCSKYLTMKGHSDKVYCTRFNDTGKYIASASCDRTVRVWSAVKGSQLVKLEGHTLMVFSCDFSRTDNGKLVASASEDRLVKIWDWEKGVETRSLLSHTGPVWSCRFSSDDKYLVSASMDHEVKIWDLAMNKPLRTFSGHKCPVHDAVFSPCGKYVYSCGRDYKIMKWAVEEDASQPNHVIEEFTGHTDIIYHIDVNKTKNQILSCSLDQTVKLWTPKSDLE